MGFETSEFPISNENKQEKESKYVPIDVLRNREIPRAFYRDGNGELIMDDPDLESINDYLNKEIKPGSVLSLASGMVNSYRMLPAIEKITQITCIDISAKNNQVNRELIEGSQNVGEQKFVEQQDIDVLNSLAEAIASKKEYGMKSSGPELLKMLSEKSQYKGEMDIITTDMIEHMTELGSGELVDGRTYDNILLLYSFYPRNKKETQEFIKNVRSRLNKGGRVIVMDVTEFEGVSEATEEDYINSEDEIVAEKYPEPWMWEEEEMSKIFNKVGLIKTREVEREIEESEEVKEAFGSYVYLTYEDKSESKGADSKG